MGGMFGESKFDIIEKIPNEVKPKTIRIKLPTTVSSVQEKLKESNLRLPLIFKPDLGERGWMVRKIRNEKEIQQYIDEIRIDFIAQELVELPLEFGVFYVRYPSEPHGKVTSIVGKEMLSVTGDGRKSLKQLVHEKERAKLQADILQNTFRDRWETAIPSGEKIELVSIGNHCLGTMFLNENHLISEKLSASFDSISKKIDGFYFGRFDLRTASPEDLEKGNVKILELNGCGAEPAHIYQPGFPLFKAMKLLIHHWHDIYRIASENHKRGVPYISFREARFLYKNFKNATAR
jgi:hypothetical protein